MIMPLPYFIEGMVFFWSLYDTFSQEGFGIFLIIVNVSFALNSFSVATLLFSPDTPRQQETVAAL